MYTDEKTTQIVLAMLKAFDIRNIVVSPGMRNCGFAASVQSDPFFQVYSVIDERSAAYFATGMSFETGRPVVIACTGATASRNYLPGLTEAYYRHLPVIALTFGHEYADAYSLTPQYTDRRVSQNDIKLCSISLPKVIDDASRRSCELELNAALIKSLYGRRGPVHIEVLYLGRNFNVTELPRVNKVEYSSVYDVMNADVFSSILSELNKKRVGVFIGSHEKMDESLTEAISAFACKYHAPVFVDHTSNYHGRHKVLIGQICDVLHTENGPDVIIDLGSICGQYSCSSLFKHAVVWRIGEFAQRAGVLKRVFDCSEEFFFRTAAGLSGGKTVNYHEEIKKELSTFQLGEIPFSGAFVARIYSKKIPAGAVFHASILNALRTANFFRFAGRVDVNCNVGGFGIDGAVSSMVGQSVASADKLIFGQVGDLAFFYDMNALGIRHISGNLRILVVNNGLGAEFRINSWLDDKLGKDGIEPYIAARGHNCSVEHWARSCGFAYMKASSREEFLSQIEDFCHPDIHHFDKPVIFEVFTTGDDEAQAIQLVTGQSEKRTCPKSIRLLSCLIPDKRKRHEFRRRHSR